MKPIFLKATRIHAADNSQMREMMTGKIIHIRGYEISGEEYPAYRIEEEWNRRHYGGYGTGLEELPDAEIAVTPQKAATRHAD